MAFPLLYFTFFPSISTEKRKTFFVFKEKNEKNNFENICKNVEPSQDYLNAVSLSPPTPQKKLHIQDNALYICFIYFFII